MVEARASARERSDVEARAVARGRSGAARRGAPPDPGQGARRRELVLLAAYVVLVVIGVWTVVVSELATQDPALREPGTVASSTQKSR